MYQIISDNCEYYVDDITYIKLNKRNGCYAICDKSEADGICAKIPKEIETESEIVVTCEDAVFSIKDGGLHGIEKSCEVKPMQAAIDYYNAKKSEEILSMLEGVL
jgi:hypothetical protein